MPHGLKFSIIDGKRSQTIDSCPARKRWQNKSRESDGDMNQWVPFQDGEYLVENAFLMAKDTLATPLEQAVVEVYTDPSGLRRVKGYGMVRNVQMVALLEDTDRIDLVLDLGSGYRFRMANPDLKAGKVFDPAVKSLLQFLPIAPWVEIGPEAFTELTAGLTWLA